MAASGEPGMMALAAAFAGKLEAADWWSVRLGIVVCATAGATARQRATRVRRRRMAGGKGGFFA
jgi:hypothetical protein